jgi:hypothetical protein
MFIVIILCFFPGSVGFEISRYGCGPAHLPSIRNYPQELIRIRLKRRRTSSLTYLDEPRSYLKTTLMNWMNKKKCFNLKTWNKYWMLIILEYCNVAFHSIRNKRTLQLCYASLSSKIKEFVFNLLVSFSFIICFTWYNCIVFTKCQNLGISSFKVHKQTTVVRKYHSSIIQQLFR